MSISTVRGFKGIDQRKTINTDLSYAFNMNNYKVTDTGALVHRYANNMIGNFGSNIEGIWSGKVKGEDITVISMGGVLYQFHRGLETLIYLGNIGTGHCEFFVFGGNLYIMNGTTYSKYNGYYLNPVSGYVPCVAMSCSPNGSGTAYEQLNLLTDYRRQQFNATGTDTVFHLAENDINSVYWVKVGGVTVFAYSTDLANGTVTFNAAPRAGLNNVEVCYSKTTGLDKTRITKCRFAMTFGGNSDGRLFLWGNSDLPAYRFYSELANGMPSAEYFPVNNYTVIGNDEITCIVQQYDKQLIFTKDKAYYSYSELKEDTLGNVYSSFPVYSMNGEKGCLLPMNGCVIDNRPVTLCNDGLNVWESTVVQNEKNAVCISGPIYKTMHDAITMGLENGTVKIFDFQVDNELFFYYGGYAYVYNYRNGSWYTYSGLACDEYCVSGGELYYSKGSKLYVYSADEGYLNNVDCSYVSTYSNFGIESGRCDIVSADLDIYVVGPVEFSIIFEQYGGTPSASRSFHYSFVESGNRRISLRPYLRRAMPVKMTVMTSGAGDCTVLGVSVNIRPRERSNRSGI